MWLINHFKGTDKFQGYFTQESDQSDVYFFQFGNLFSFIDMNYDD